ncbi:MAG TPA: hypothetical protein PKC40_05885 [Saprospiraceae bacterium]|nr:hypothetical protein [Saprospiraceae bacterium]
MAGYIFNLDSLKSLQLYAANSVYATKMGAPQGIWKLYHEGTFADYVTMQPGDNIYFFIQRKIYGIGQLVAVGDDCKYFNFPEATIPHAFDYEKVKDHLLWNEADYSTDQRCICLFEPAPYFFTEGIDMDDVLASRPQAFRMLRAFWKLSFIKFDDEENQAFKDVILKHNQAALANPQPGENIFLTSGQSTHQQIAGNLQNQDYRLNALPILAHCSESGILGHEMALELGLLYQLSQKDVDTVNIFGDWDYLSHQVIASPFKPVDYMDKMDLFGYSFIPGYRPTRGRYLVGELKKDTAHLEHLEQLMKYVDWVNAEYAYGDYGMIHAFLVALDFDDHVLDEKTTIGSRKYTFGMRPARSTEWKNLKLIKYAFRGGKVVFEEVTHGSRTLFSD